LNLLVYDPRRGIVFFVLLIVSFGFQTAPAQDSVKSPVFRGFRAKPKQSFILEQSDLTYQMWQTFSLTQRANSDDPVAQHELGVRYLIGRGVNADTVRGAYWTERSAGHNYSPAQFNYGILLFNGWGVEWNPFRAFDCFNKSAVAGLPEAQYILGQFYFDNLVVGRDWTKAYDWVKAAADSGFAPALELLPELARRTGRADSGSSRKETAIADKDSAISGTWSLVFLDMDEDTSKHVVSDSVLLNDARREGALSVHSTLTDYTEQSPDSLTILKVRESANAGSPEALVLLGRFHQMGIRPATKDKVLAASFYIRAIRAASLRAPSLLWELSEKDLKLGDMQFRSERGDVEAKFVLAGLAGLGFAMPFINAQSILSDSQVVDLLRTSAEAKHIPSMIELGLCYYSGRGIKQNEGRALDLWRDAEKLGSVEASVRRVATELAREDGDDAEQIAILSSASQAGSILADVALGLLYERGERRGEAALRYRKAAERGSRDAYIALARLHDELRPKETRFRIDD